MALLSKYDFLNLIWTNCRTEDKCFKCSKNTSEKYQPGGCLYRFVMSRSQGIFYDALKNGFVRATLKIGGREKTRRYQVSPNQSSLFYKQYGDKSGTYGCFQQ
jgi:hypothetical protein